MKGSKSSKRGRLAEVEARVRQIAGALAGRSPDEIGAEEPLFEGGLDLDSVSAAALLSELDACFGVSIAEADVELHALRRIDTLSRLVTSLVAEAEATQP